MDICRNQPYTIKLWKVIESMSKKSIAIISILILLTLLAAPAFGANSGNSDVLGNTSTATPIDKTTLEKVNALHNMGLYAGTSTITFNPDLDGRLTREQGVVILLKMLGKNNEVQALSDADATTALAGFSDRASVADWAKKYVAYSIKNNIVGGFPDKTLRGSTQFTGNQFATLLLKSAGYTITAGTFSQATAIFAEKAGLQSPSFLRLSSLPILKSNAIDMCFGQLGVPIKGKNVTVIQDLVNKGVVTGSSAQNAGFTVTSPPTATTSTSALSATGEQINKQLLDVNTGTGKALATDQD